MVTQLAREFGAYVIGTGRAADRQKSLGFGAMELVDLVFDVIGSDIQQRSAGLVRAGGTLVSVVGPAGRAAGSGRDGSGRTSATLDDAVAAFNPAVTGRLG